jgi:hypothetical protein
MTTRIPSCLLPLFCAAALAGCGDAPTTAASSREGASVNGQPSCPDTACSLLQREKVQSLFGPALGPGEPGPEISGEVSVSSCSYTSSELPISSVVLQVRCAAGSDANDEDAVRASMATMFGKAPVDVGDAARPALWTSKRFGNAGGTTGELYVFAAGGVQIAVSVITPLTDALALAYSQELARQALEAAGQGR